MSDTREERVGDEDAESVDVAGANPESVTPARPDAVDAETDTPSEDEPDDEDVDTSHLDGVDDGCGCAEVWEHLSEEREE